MPTYFPTARFRRDLERLPAHVRARFARCVAEEFVPAITAGPPFPPGLRIKRVQGTRDVWEMTFAPDGRATFAFGQEVRAGEPHIIWRRVGDHASVFGNP